MLFDETFVKELLPPHQYIKSSQVFKRHSGMFLYGFYYVGLPRHFTKTQAQDYILDIYI